MQQEVEDEKPENKTMDNRQCYSCTWLCKNVDSWSDGILINLNLVFLDVEHLDFSLNLFHFIEVLLRFKTQSRYWIENIIHLVRFNK